MYIYHATENPVDLVTIDVSALAELDVTHVTHVNAASATEISGMYISL